MPAGASNPVAWLLRNNVGFSSVNRAGLRVCGGVGPSCGSRVCNLTLPPPATCACTLFGKTVALCGTKMSTQQGDLAAVSCPRREAMLPGVEWSLLLPFMTTEKVEEDLGPRHQCSLSVLQGPEGRGRHCDQLGGSGGRRSDQWSPDSSVIHWVEWGDGGVTRGAQTAV
ncbi:unnamed protein product [Boreogadus saida]